MLEERLAAIEQRYEQLNEEMVRPEVIADVARLQKLARELASIEEIVARHREYRDVLKEIASAESMLREDLDSEMERLVREELASLRERRDALEVEVKRLLLPKDPNDEKNVIVEIRAGTGGDEAGLFAADLFRMYTRYADSKGWTTEVLNSHESGIGGFKEIIFEVNGPGAYSRLKYEGGVHRVQRVPATESSGRIHTSTASVVVLPEVEDVEVDINEDDIRVDIFHSGGAGGQNVNKVATAVRMTHLPTGIVVVCQDERSQLKNRMKAMAVLRARLYEIEQRKQQSEVSQARRSMVGSAERSEKIRTYNFPQDRVTDHRIGLTLHNLPAILDGALDPLIDAVATADQAQRLSENGQAA